MQTKALEGVALTILIVALSVLGLGAGARAESTGDLDGLVFEVETVDESGKNHSTDRFVFADGRLSTSEMRNLGCWPIGYETKQARAGSAPSGSTRFEATFVTPEGHSVRIEGVVRGSHIEGSIRWLDPEYQETWKFSGTRAEGLLDGTRFSIEIESDESSLPFERNESEEPEESSNPWEYALPEEFSQGSDLLVFERGGFESKNCSAVGFSRTSYSAAEYGGAITFAASGACEMVGTVDWSGTVEDDNIEGEIRWTNLDGMVVYYSFTGKRVTG